MMTLSNIMNTDKCFVKHPKIAISLWLMMSLWLPGVSADSMKSSSGESDTVLQSIVHGLDYISVDYPSVVDQGKVLDEDEYAEQLEIAVIVGVPYPKPTARQRGLQHYYDLKFRKGWEYTVEAPTARKPASSSMI